MYINQSESSIKAAQSYVISASFKGILRLSPNNYNTIYENNPVQLTVEQDNSISTSYTDAIVLDDNAIPSDPKEDEFGNRYLATPDIRYRMIIGSDSDGYLVPFRVSDEDLEFDKLGVIGIAETGKLTIYSTCNEAEKYAFKLGNTIMPSLPNKLPSSRGIIRELIGDYKSTDVGRQDARLSGKSYPEDFDEVQIKITENGDKSYVLIGAPDKDGNRVFSYKRTQQFIRDSIMEAMLSIQSVPTGSIHWLPVTFEQYKHLVNTNKCYPNRYFGKTFTGDDDDNVITDPIIRDYLLCDGRKYNTYEFPELAKILYGEKITFWDSDGVMREHINGKWNELDRKSKEEMKEAPSYFRVPDLRNKFISYVAATGSNDPLDGQPVQVQNYKNAGNNLTGTYTPDNSPRNPSGNNDDEKHFHFLAYASYTAYNVTGENDRSMYGFKPYDFNENLGDNGTDMRVWYLSNTAGDTYEEGTPGAFGYGFGACGDRRRMPSDKSCILAHAYASVPNGGHDKHKISPTYGKTSPSKIIYTVPEQIETTYKITRYETYEEYNQLESGIQIALYINDKESTATPQIDSRHGHENAPKHYTFLPLIKI